MVLAYDILMYTSALSYIIPLYLLINDKTLSIILKVLSLFLVLSLATEFVSFYAINIQHKDNKWVLHIYTLICQFNLSLFYWFLIQNRVIRIFILAFNCLFLLFFIYNIQFITDNLMRAQLAYLLSSMFLICISSFYFYKVYTEMKITNLFQDGLFWINSAFLIYFSSTFYVSLFEEYIRSEDLNLLYYTWPIQLVSTIIFNVILSRGIWLMRKQ
jgi:hypothetical protein